MARGDRPATDARVRRPRVGGVLLGLGALASLAVIAWGVGDSAPQSVSKAAVAKVAFAKVEKGTLTETTRVTGTMSRGDRLSGGTRREQSSGGCHARPDGPGCYNPGSYNPRSCKPDWRKPEPGAHGDGSIGVGVVGG